MFINFQLLIVMGFIMIESTLARKVVFIIVYYGKEWPRLLPPFLISTLENSSDIDFLFVSNMDQFPVKTAANVRLVTKSLLALNELLFTMLNMSTTNAITFKTAYKLVDFKPMFGYLFSDLITDYDYWGHLDADTILSRLIDPAFILEKHLRNYNDDGGSGVDVLSATNSMCNGPMQLYRNTRRINKLFELSRDISLVVNSTQNLGFTENHGIMRAPFPIVLRKAVIQNKVRWNRTTNTYLEDRWYFRNGAEKHMVSIHEYCCHTPIVMMLIFSPFYLVTFSTISI